jgi:hypothetical protein
METRETCRQLASLANDEQWRTCTSGSNYSQSSILLDYIIKMKDVTVDKLMTSVEQESMQADYINEMINRSEDAEAKKRELQVALAKERDDKETNVSFYNGIIIKLKAELQDIASSSSKALSLLHDETERVQGANKLAWEEENVNRAASTEATRRELVAGVEVNSTNEEAMRKKKTKMSIEVSSWIDKYDRDISKLHADIDSMRAKFEKEKAEREILEHDFGVKDLDLKYERDEEAAILKRKKERERDAFLLMKAAQLIQKLCRGRLAR